MEVEKEVMACMNDMLDIVVNKEKKRLRNKEYREKNKEKISQQLKQYYQENKLQISQKQKQHYEENREKILQQQKKYHEKNRVKILQRQNEYDRRPERVKLRRIYDWKKSGVICDNFDALYNHYLKTSYCEFCRCELTYDTITTATTKCLDHDHNITDRPNFRNILCNSCNLKRR